MTILFIRRFLFAFFANFLVLGAVAAIFGDLVQGQYFPELASAEPNFLLLTLGSLAGSLILALLFPRLGVSSESDWFSSSVKLALPIGLLVYFATHLVQTGYIQVSTTGWLLEGLYDSLAPMASIVAMAYNESRLTKKGRA